MASELRITVPLARVLQVFLRNPDERHYGYELMELERAEWIKGAQEEIDPQAEGRPRRRYFTLTSDGICLAERGLARLRQDLGVSRSVPGQFGLHGGIA
jgi:PadR family transcriptional regulator, regulatory protein PadR